MIWFSKCWLLKGQTLNLRVCPFLLLFKQPLAQPLDSVSQIVGFLKGKSNLMIFDRHANLKYKYGNRHFWARGYYVDTVGRNKKQESAARRSFGRP